MKFIILLVQLILSVSCLQLHNYKQGNVKAQGKLENLSKAQMLDSYEMCLQRQSQACQWLKDTVDQTLIRYLTDIVGKTQKY